MRKFVPQSIIGAYHYLLAWGAALFYGNPSRKMVVIGITGTKGKSTTTELVAAVLRAAGHPTAVASTIHFVIDQEEQPNLYKMTMPGRGRLQKFLRDAAAAGCTHAVVEMTSEGARQYRHIGIELDALIFTNLSPEHIESHGSFEKYAAAKLSLAEHLSSSRKRPRIIVANADDAYGEKFLAVEAEVRAPFSLLDAQPYTTDDRSARFVWRGEVFAVPLPGEFNLKNCLAALTLGEALGIPLPTLKQALEHMGPIAGRAERVECGQPFAVVVDYAHTADSLKALYGTYAGAGEHTRRLVCVLGSTGGGRDQWKRPEMGKLADQYCEHIVLTNEDPYDEDPQKIIAEVAAGITTKKPTTILDRRAAIAAALTQAQTLRQSAEGSGVAVLITGKGTDPYIMGPRGTKEPWSDARIAAEELQKLGYH